MRYSFDAAVPQQMLFSPTMWAAAAPNAAGPAVPKAGPTGHCFSVCRMSRVLGMLEVSLLLLAFLGTAGADSVSIAVVNGKTTVTASGNSNDACPNAQYQVHDFSVARFRLQCKRDCTSLHVCGAGCSQKFKQSDERLPLQYFSYSEMLPPAAERGVAVYTHTSGPVPA